MLKSRLPTERTDSVLCWFSALGLGPNHWTMLSLVPASVGFLALASHRLAAGLVLFAASGFIDMVDGAVARVTNSSTASGAFIDGVMDRYVELLLCLGLTLYLGPEAYLLLPIPFWMVLMIFGSVIFDENWLLWAIIVVAVLSNVTAVQRIIFAVRRGR